MYRKKLAAVILSVVMACGSLPVNALATDSGKEAVVGVETLASAAEEKESKEAAPEKTESQPETQKETEAPQTEQKETAASTEGQGSTETQTESSAATESTDTSEKETESETAGAAETESETETASETETETEAESEETTTVDEESAALKKLKDASGVYYGGGSSVKETAKFVPGSYTVTANLYVPGEYNEVLNINAFMTNPNNPMGIGGHNGIPNTPVSGNAKLVIGEDGTTKTLTLDIPNPVFTLQGIAGCENAAIADNGIKVKTDVDERNTLGRRIEQITVILKDNSGKYQFNNCQEFPTILGQMWKVPLILEVDLASVPTDSTVKLSYGEAQTWETGSVESIHFEAAESFSKFQGVQIDGTTIDASLYSAFAYKGGTYVDLNALYLGTLSTGTHQITILFANDFFSTTTFRIKAPGEDETISENEAAAKALTAGTYRITANLYLPGELNTQLPGTTAYLTNPSNPLGIGGNDGIPMTPVSDNATLVVDKDGNKTVIVDIVNPVFTLQGIKNGKTISVLWRVKDSETYTGVSGEASRTGRITQLCLKLGDNSGVYQFGDCTEFPTLLEVDWNVPLQLGVDFTSAKKTSDSTTVTMPAGAERGDSAGTISGDDKTNKKEEETKKSSGTIKPGKYTVAANIWIDRSSSGLPLSPHLTSSVFPPKDPVSKNATVTIDEDYNATVKVPIVIQSKVMSIKSISGLNIISSTKSGGYLTSITVDLGKVTDPNAVITKSCTVSLDLGDLAQQIAKKGREQTWGATFQVNFSGVASSASGGGNVDINALLNGTNSAKGTNIRIGVAADSNLAALIPMIEDHKSDTEIPETTESEASAATTAATTGSSASTTQTEVKNSYLFTIETLSDSALQEAEAKKAKEEGTESAELTEEEKADLLSEQYLQHFANGTYDLAYITAGQAEALTQMDSFKNSFYILALVDTDSSEEAEAVDGEETAPAMLLAVSKSFVDSHATVLTEIVSNVKASAKEAAEKPEETAAAVVSLGLGSDSAQTLELLKIGTLTVTSGSELQSTVDDLAKDTAYADLSSELVYTAAGTAQTTTAQTEASAEEQTESESEKIEITDADSLSAALDAALAAKGDGESTEEAGGTGDTVTTATSYSNSSSLDMEAEKAAAEALEPGTYTLSVNLYLPGERNTQLPGTTAYMTNPDNPLGVGGHEGIPMSPVADNATLVVAEDGTKTVTVDIVNPVFTLQKIAAPQNSTILAGTKDSDRYEGTNGVGVDGRITQLVIELGDDGGIYPFDDCAEFPTLLETDWYVPLEMSVEFTTAEKVSDETAVDVPEDTAGAETVL